MIKLITLDIQNFMSYGDEIQRFDFTTKSYPALILGENRLEFSKKRDEKIYGSNGAGKTSFFEAIYYAFYDDTKIGRAHV